MMMKMKYLVCLFTTLAITACAQSPSDDATPNLEETSAPVLISARQSDGLEAIQNEAATASAAACHGTTLCPGGVFIANGLTNECGATSCSTTSFGCGKPGSEHGVRRQQPLETYTSYAMPGGLVCLAYHPAGSKLLTACCPIDQE
jgi:hypothetical protein